jgi:cytochrome P460
MKSSGPLSLAVSFLLLLSGATARPAETSAEALTYTSDGKLVKPVDYREWVAIGTGLNMSYGPLRDERSSRPPFTNVFVNPSSYRSFLKTGAWPDRTVFVLEVRSSVAVNNSTTGNNGYFQGEILGIEAEVKDEKRFPGKWAFFNLGKSSESGEQIPTGASCYSCHAKNAAVENTFVQFYPVLRDVAKEKGTLKTVAEQF